MEKINTDYKRRIWKIEDKLFNMRKPWLSPFKQDFSEVFSFVNKLIAYSSFPCLNFPHYFVPKKIQF